MVHLQGAHISKTCTRRPKYAHRVQGAPLISNTDCTCSFISVKKDTISECDVILENLVPEKTKTKCCKCHNIKGDFNGFCFLCLIDKENTLYTRCKKSQNETLTCGGYGTGFTMLSPFQKYVILQKLFYVIATMY